MAHSRDNTLALLNGQPIGRIPVFGGLPSLTDGGLNAVGVAYHDAHTDSGKMAAAAASTFELCGFESAVVPFDLCVEAEVLGCPVDFQTDLDIFMPPVVAAPLTRFPQNFPMDVSRAGRIPLVARALHQLRAGVGREISIGAWVPGPFTLAWQLFGGDGWFSALQDTTRVQSWLERLAAILAQVAAVYREAGADFVTVHEMGGSPQVVGPSNFRALVQPALAQLLSAMPSPKVLSVCGDTNAAIIDLAACGADALNVDHRNDLARTRELLPTAVLLGNLDPVHTLSQGTPAEVAAAVQSAAGAGANAFWAGCDLVPNIPPENLRAWITSSRAARAKTTPLT